MNMTQAQAERVVEELADAGIEASVRDYSGRGMYGKRCIGIVGPDVAEIARAIGRIEGRAGDDNWNDENMGEIRYDSMGRDVIVY